MSIGKFDCVAIFVFELREGLGDARIRGKRLGGISEHQRDAHAGGQNRPYELSHRWSFLFCSEIQEPESKDNVYGAASTQIQNLRLAAMIGLAQTAYFTGPAIHCMNPPPPDPTVA